LILPYEGPSIFTYQRASDLPSRLYEKIQSLLSVNVEQINSIIFLQTLEQFAAEHLLDL